MRRISTFSSLLLICCVLVLALPLNASAATTIVVKPSSPNGWGFLQETPNGLGSLVGGPATPPSGGGSARLQVDSSGGEIVAAAIFTGIKFTDITSLSYSTYRSSADAGNNLAIALQFSVDYDLADAAVDWQGRLVFEPYRTPGVGGTVGQNTWQTWSPLTGKWWASGAPGSTLCPQSTPCDWTTVLSNWPNAGIHATLGGVSFKAGGGWAGGFDGNVDAFTMGVSGNDTTYDFEPETQCTTTCYVNAATGNDTFGGDTPTSAKKTIQAAIDAVSPGGTVRVLPGTYSETAANRTLFDASGPYQFGLFIGQAKSGITVMGVTAGDVPITDPTATLATVNTNATNNFGTSGVFVEGDNVTLQGLRFGPNTGGDNKAIEVIGDAFVLKYSTFAIVNGGALYFGDWRYDAGTNTSYIKAYTVEGNRFDDGTQIAFSSGAGFSGSVANRKIINNTFVGITGQNWVHISFNGAGGVPWFTYPVGGAVITGNSFSGSTQHIRARGNYTNSEMDWTSYWNDNSLRQGGRRSDWGLSALRRACVQLYKRLLHLYRCTAHWCTDPGRGGSCACH